MENNQSLIALQNHLSASQGLSTQSLSLRDRVQAQNAAKQGNILLLDTSYSMNETISGHNRRIDILWHLVQEIRSSNIPFQVCEFNNTAHFSEGIEKPEPEGGTNLCSAFELLLTRKPSKIILITDGETYDTETAFMLARQLQCPMNVMYVGPDDYDSSSAQEFCKRLAEIGNGTYSKNALTTEMLQISATNAVRLLLIAGTAESGKGQINL